MKNKLNDHAKQPYLPRASALTLFRETSEEIILSGPAGTGKSRACLEKIHIQLERWPGSRALILRKTRTSLTETGLVTFEQNVLPVGHPARTRVQRRTRQAYTYPNGSTLVVAGIDDPQRIMSTEYDLIYVQEATELTEAEWEHLLTRLRNGVMPTQQLLADCNPDAPTHWIKRRADAGLLRMLESRHEDNPRLFNLETGEWTKFGQTYIEKLERLTGPRYQRLRHGRWVGAEGVVYEGFDRAIHLIERDHPSLTHAAPLYDPNNAFAHYAIPRFCPSGIPYHWKRYWVVDFGFTNPFVWQAWAEDPDGRLYRYREIYHTQRLVEDHAKDILQLTKGEPKPEALICDHDAEDRATLQRYLDFFTKRAHKSVSDGIQAVASRLRVAGDGKPRLFLLKDSLHQRDEELAQSGRPTCTEEEMDCYVWNETNGKRKGEEPLKENDHGMDAMRYAVANKDLKGKTWSTNINL